ncbi:MAG: pilus assembly protein PilM [Planctomycetota bacterium]
MGQNSSWIRRQVHPIGIDFGTRFIRMLQLARHGGQFEIVGCAHRAVPPNLQSPLDYDRFRSRAVGQMLEEGGFVGNEVVSALGWSDLWMRSIRVPMMPIEKTKEVVRFEAAECLELDPNDDQIRFMIAGDVRQGMAIYQEVLVFGAGRKTVENHLDMLTRLGLLPVYIDAGPCAIFRPFERFLKRETDAETVNVFLDLGYKASRVVISRGAELVFIKSIPIASSQFNQLVSEQLDLSLEEVIQIRGRLHNQYLAGLEGDPRHTDPDEAVGETLQRAVLDTLRPFVEQLGKEISLCMRYCSSTFRVLRYDKITVVGGEAYNTDILRLLSDQVGITFETGRPMRNISSHGRFDGMNRRAGRPEWTTAVGLALKPVYEMAEVTS